MEEFADTRSRALDSLAAAASTPVSGAASAAVVLPLSLPGCDWLTPHADHAGAPYYAAPAVKFLDRTE